MSGVASGRAGVGLPALGVAVAALLAHGAAFRNGFVWDDEAIVVEHPTTRDLAALGRVLLSPDQRPPYYRPLNRASYLLDHALFGMDPRAYHAVNLALHALSAVLLLLLARRLLRDSRLAALAALVLAVHPLACEAVSFVTARNNLFALAFSLASALAFAVALERRSSGHAVLSAAAFLLGLLSKEPAAMTLPLLASWLVLPRLADAASPEAFLRRARLLLPHLTALCVYLALRAVSFSGVPVPVDPPPPDLLERLAILGWTVPTYLKLLAWPAGLSVFHEASPSSSSGALLALAVAWAALLAAAAVVVRRPSPAGATGLLWMALFFAPASGLVAFPAAPVAERFAYLALAGAGLLLADLVGRLGLSGRKARAASALAGLVLVGLASRAAVRTLDWKDDVALFASATRVDPASRAAWFNLGVALKDRGRLEEARTAWETAVRLDPSDAQSHTQLGALHGRGGDYALAEHHLRAALAARPGLAQARFNLALALERTGRPLEAAAEYESVTATAQGTELGAAAAERARSLRANRAGDVR